MLRALFLLSFVGGALYAGLVATHAALTPEVAKDSEEYAYVLAIRPPAVDAASGALRSWGSSLQALRSQPQLPPTAPKPAGDQDNRPVPALQAVAAAGSAGAVSQDERIGWTKVTLAARAHGGASVSSPITHFYPAGAELEVMDRNGAWIDVRDPATQARGWVLETYVAAIDRPSATQVAAAEPEPAPAVEAAPKPKNAKTTATKAKKRSVKPQATSAMLLAKADAERGRVAQRGERRGLGLLLFGRRMATLDAEGRVTAR